MRGVSEKMRYVDHTTRFTPLKKGHAWVYLRNGKVLEFSDRESPEISSDFFKARNIINGDSSEIIFIPLTSILYVVFGTG